MHELGIPLLSYGKIVKLMLGPPVPARVSVANTVGHFYISTGELWRVSQFPSRNQSAVVEVPAFQKRSSDLSGMNEKVVSLENVGLSLV